MIAGITGAYGLAFVVIYCVVCFGILRAITRNNERAARAYQAMRRTRSTSNTSVALARASRGENWLLEVPTDYATPYTSTLIGGKRVVDEVVARLERSGR